MDYSLARYRFLSPVTPFFLGGRYFRLENRHFMGDAAGRVELEAAPPLFVELNSGDHIVAQVVGQANDKLQCQSLRLLARGPGGVSVTAQTPAEFTRFVQLVREFFVQRGLRELVTPSLVVCPGLEPSLEPFSLQVKRGREVKAVFLPTSPEIHLKKALTKGWTDIFEIKSCFRAGEFSPQHENEFLMLEWYRAYADLHLIAEDLRELLVELTDKGFIERAPAVRTTTFKELFATALDFALTPQTTSSDLRELCQRLQVHYLPEDTFNDLFHRLLLERLEAQLAKMGAVIVCDFPPSQAALARLTAEGWADRFEFYWRGLEIANAFNEVTAADEMRRRWNVEQAERARLGTSPLPQDAELLRAMEEHGLPPTGGIALGMERLFMACTGVSEIRDLRLFATDDLFTSRR